MSGIARILTHAGKSAFCHKIIVPVSDGLRCLLSLLAALVAAVLTFGCQAAMPQAAGILVSAQEVAEPPAEMRAWRVAYWTTDADGRALRVTGMVIAPAARSGGKPRRVIAWAHGLIGIAQRCAPSIGEGNFTMIPKLDSVIRRGYTVVAPDYPGLGSDMVHPVLVGVSEGRSVLDAVRAARAIPEADAGSRFAVWGESQGGHAALWTGQLWRTYAPDLQLVGIAAIVPPTELRRNFSEGADPRARALLTAYIGTSWSRYYGASLAAFGTRSVRGVMTRLADNNCVQFETKPRIGTMLGVVIVQRAIRKLDLGTKQPWADLMRKNSPSPAAIPVPAFIATGTADTIVAPAVVEDFARRACRLGKAVNFVSISGGQHTTVTGRVSGRPCCAVDRATLADLRSRSTTRRHRRDRAADRASPQLQRGRCADPRARALLTAYIGTSWSRYYGASLAAFGTRSVRGVMTRLADNNCVQFETKPRIGTMLGVVIVQRAIRKLDLGTKQPWADLMRKNSPSPAAIPVPAFIATGTADTIVAPAVVEDFARRACRLLLPVRVLGKLFRRLFLTRLMALYEAGRLAAVSRPSPRR